VAVLFLQCSYFNFINCTTFASPGLERPAGSTSVLIPPKASWRSWRRFMTCGSAGRIDSSPVDFWQRELAGLPADSADPRNNRWYSNRPLMIANSALCFGTYAFVLANLPALSVPLLFLPAIVVGMNLYWLAIVLARLVVFRRTV